MIGESAFATSCPLEQAIDEATRVINAVGDLEDQVHTDGAVIAARQECMGTCILRGACSAEEDNIALYVRLFSLAANIGQSCDVDEEVV